MDYDFDVLVVGAGVIGLAAARDMAGRGLAVGLLEKNSRYGLETSSRNSEVIHSGIHYRPGSLKARLCVRGGALLYEYCRARKIRHQSTGKYTIAVTAAEVETLEKLHATGRENGVEGLAMAGAAAVAAAAPGVRCRAALFTPSSGILDAHQLMDRLYGDFAAAGGLAGFGEAVTAAAAAGEGYAVTSAAGEGPREYTARVLVNCAGLQADRVAAMLGAAYELYWAKGDYFSLAGAAGFRTLVYPVPAPGFLGIHLTPLAGGGLRAGPDIEYVEKRWPPYPVGREAGRYRVDAGKRPLFHAAVKKYLPGLAAEALVPEMYGLRPKLQGPEDGFTDFVIRPERPGFINLVGMESPGLTSCLAIGEHVGSLAAAALGR